MWRASSDTSLQGWHMREMSWGSAASQVDLGILFAWLVMMVAMAWVAAATVCWSLLVGCCRGERCEESRWRGGKAKHA